MDVDLKVFEALTDQKSFWNEYLQMLTDTLMTLTESLSSTKQLIQAIILFTAAKK